MVELESGLILCDKVLLVGNLGRLFWLIAHHIEIVELGARVFAVLLGSLGRLGPPESLLVVSGLVLIAKVALVIGVLLAMLLEILVSTAIFDKLCGTGQDIRVRLERDRLNHIG